MYYTGSRTVPVLNPRYQHIQNRIFRITIWQEDFSHKHLTEQSLFPTFEPIPTNNPSTHALLPFSKKKDAQQKYVSQRYSYNPVPFSI